MESLDEIFRNLSDSDKFKFLEKYLNPSKEHNPASCDENTKSSENLNPVTFLDLLKTRSKDAAKSTSSSSNICKEAGTKKQKTLDGWVIKRNSTSPSKSDSLKLSFQTNLQCDKNSDVNISENDSNLIVVTGKNADNCSSSTSSTSLICENQSGGRKDLFRISSETRSFVDNNVQDSLSKDIESTGIVTEKCTLRSKRKLDKPSPVSDRPSKCFMNNVNNNIISHTDTDFICSNELTNKLTQVTDISLAQLNELPKNVESISKLENCNSIKETNSNINHHLDISANKTSYNLRAKKKKLKSSISVESNSNIPNSEIVCSDSSLPSYNLRTKRKDLKCKISAKPICNMPCCIVTSDEIDDNDKKASPGNKKQVSTVLPQCSSYEAFHLLDQECSRIGLNIVDILQHENIQSVLNDSEKLSNEAVILVGSSQSSNGPKLPVVHLIDSKKKLFEIINKLRNGKI